MGLNEFSGYFAVAGSALATGLIAAQYGLRPQPFHLGVAFDLLGLGLSMFVVREIASAQPPAGRLVRDDQCTAEMRQPCGVRVSTTSSAPAEFT